MEISRVKPQPTDLERMRTLNLTFVCYTFIMNVCYFLVVPAWQLFLLLFVLVGLPMVHNVAWTYAPLKVRCMMLPLYGWGHVIMLIAFGLAILGFLTPAIVHLITFIENFSSIDSSRFTLFNYNSTEGFVSLVYFTTFIYYVTFLMHFLAFKEVRQYIDLTERVEELEKEFKEAEHEQKRK